LHWQVHELTARASDACLPAIKLHFDSEKQLISDSIFIDFGTDSLNFVTIRGIPVANPQQQVTNYEYIHDNPVPGKNFTG
jgi:hypothetical protein